MNLAVFWWCRRHDHVEHLACQNVVAPFFTRDTLYLAVPFALRLYSDVKVSNVAKRRGYVSRQRKPFKIIRHLNFPHRTPCDTTTPVTTPIRTPVFIQQGLFSSLRSVLVRSATCVPNERLRICVHAHEHVFILGGRGSDILGRGESKREQREGLRNERPTS